MTSWRDSASQQAQHDLDGLLDASLPFAQEMLDKHGEFFPYACALSSSGETKLVAGDPGEGEQPSSVDVLQVLVEGLRAERDTLRAAALVSDVRLSDSDAVRVQVEHKAKRSRFFSGTGRSASDGASSSAKSPLAEVIARSGPKTCQIWGKAVSTRSSLAPKKSAK